MDNLWLWWSKILCWNCHWVWPCKPSHFSFSNHPNWQSPCPIQHDQCESHLYSNEEWPNILLSSYCTFHPWVGAWTSRHLLLPIGWIAHVHCYWYLPQYLLDCPKTQPIFIMLQPLSLGSHKMCLAIPQGDTNLKAPSWWNCSCLHCWVLRHESCMWSQYWKICECLLLLSWKRLWCHFLVCQATENHHLIYMQHGVYSHRQSCRVPMAAWAYGEYWTAPNKPNSAALWQQCSYYSIKRSLFPCSCEAHQHKMALYSQGGWWHLCVLCPIKRQCCWHPHKTSGYTHVCLLTCISWLMRLALSDWPWAIGPDSI